MRIVRAPRPAQGYLPVDNRLLRDNRISDRARGLLLRVLSYPDGWQTDSRRLADGAREGRDAVRAAIGELEAAGYWSRTRRQDPSGQWTTMIEVRDTPADGFPDDARPHPVPDIPAPESPTTDSQPLAPPTQDTDSSEPYARPEAGRPGAGRPGAIRKDCKKEELKPPPTAQDADLGGGDPPDENQETARRVLDTVAATWRRPAGSLATRTTLPRTVAAIAEGWPPDALGRHLADCPPRRIHSPVALVLRRLDDLPAAPGLCACAACERWRTVQTATLAIDRRAEQAALAAAAARRRAANDRITTALGPTLTSLIVAAHASAVRLGAHHTVRLRPGGGLTRGVLAGVYAGHDHDVDRIRAYAETLVITTAAA